MKMFLADLYNQREESREGQGPKHNWRQEAYWEGCWNHYPGKGLWVGNQSSGRSGDICWLFTAGEGETECGNQENGDSIDRKRNQPVCFRYVKLEVP